MDIYVFQENRSAELLRELCFRYLFQKNDSGEVYIIPEMSILKGEEGMDGVLSVFFADTGRDLDALSRAIRRRNPGHYVLVVIRDLSEILRMVPPSVRPSGFVTEPPEWKQIFSLLDEIERDCQFWGDGEDSFFFKVKARQYLVPCGRILYFESCNKKIILRTKSQEFEFYETLAQVHERLPEGFLRIHKSFLVNMDYVREVDYVNMSVKLSDGSGLLLSRSHKRELQEALEKKKKVRT